MSQGRTRQAWAVMIKLVPSTVYTDIANDNQQEDEIKKVCQLKCIVLL